MEAHQKWGTMTQVADILGVSAGTVDRWIREGRVRFRKLGQRLSLEDAAHLVDVGEDAYKEYMREAGLS